MRAFSSVATRLARFVDVNLRHRQKVIGRFEVRAQDDHLAEVLGRLRRFVRLEGEATQKIVGLRIGRVVAHNRLELLGGQLVVAVAQVNVRQIGPHPLANGGASGSRFSSSR